MLNYADYKRLISICGKDFYNENYELLRDWAGTQSDLSKEILKTGKYGTSLSVIEDYVDASLEILHSQFVDFPCFGGIKSNTFFDSQVPPEARDEDLRLLIEEYLSQLEGLRLNVVNGYGLTCWHPDSWCNYIPNVCLKDDIIHVNIAYSERDLKEIDKEIAEEFNYSRDNGFLNTNVVLSDFIETQNIIIIYYQAIFEYSNVNNLEWEEVLFGVLAHEFCRAGYYKAVNDSENGEVWDYYFEETNIGEMCADIIDGMAQFYSYIMLDAYYGKSKFADRMKDRWQRNFTSNDSYAQALYFLYNGSKPFPDITAAIDKFSDVCDPFKTLIQAFYTMRFGFTSVTIDKAIN